MSSTTENPGESADPRPELRVTEDGSHTLYSHRFEQHYHNPNGAVAESRHNFFIKNGLLNHLPGADHLTILEVGFGTGLNFLLLMDEYLETGSSTTIDYFTVEAYPVDARTARTFNYGEYLAHPDLTLQISQIFKHLKPGLNRFEPAAGITLQLYHGPFSDFSPQNLDADYIFHDPFSPQVNPELWTGEVFRKLAAWSSPPVILSTYSAASKARGAMAWAGWHVAREEGALGKREMTIAALDPEKLAHLERVNEQRLARRYEQQDF
ncbi:MAG: tRNA (5-methylaminomethyl-2-thiouridine)(34)-methyltransferase MnmD [Balneolaceae bacterium]|nr:tRNA (5-methylaminomethyl-2-thiouridine)(34)-methyltransferase MnmD [Balneolaceae bacterium]